MIVNILNDRYGVREIVKENEKSMSIFKKFNNYIIIDRKNITKAKKIIENAEKNLINELTDELILETSTKNNISIDEAIKWLNPFRVEFDDDGKLYSKIILKDNYSLYEIKELLYNNGIDTYEGDLSVVDRYIIDKLPNMDLELNKLDIVYYDIETYDIGELQNDEYGRIIPTTPILSIAMIDNKGNKKFIANLNKDNVIAGEKELLIEFLNYVYKYDIIIGWRSSMFDDVYIENRSEYHGIYPQQFKRLVKIDYWKLYEDKVQNKPDKVSLDNVAEFEVGINKVKINTNSTKTIGNGRIVELWEKHICSYSDNNISDVIINDIFNRYGTNTEVVSLLSYNYKDVLVLQKLEEKLKLLDILVSMANLNNILISQTLKGSKFWDIKLIRYFNDLGVRLQHKYKVTKSDNIVTHTIILDDDYKPIKIEIVGSYK